jgi:imidazolonepropionase-like amidohydrolase
MHRLFLAPLLALSVAATAAEPPSKLAIKAAKLIDGRGGAPLLDAVVLIEGDLITAVGSRLPIPAGTKVLDLGSATLLPGLIDLHVHLTARADRHGYRGLAASLPKQTLDGAANARTTLLAGFTTVRNVGADGFTDVALREAIGEGEIPGPRLLVSGPALGITGGHCDNNLLPAEWNAKGEGIADGPDAARARVRENFKYGADLIKICASGGVLSKGDAVGAAQYTIEEMTAIANEAHRQGKKVAAHAHGALSIREAIASGIDSIEHASLIDDEGIRMAKEKGTVLVMDIYNDDYILQEGEKAGILPESIEKEKAVGKAQREGFQRATKAGAKMAFGTDAGVYPHGDNARQFKYMVQYGMTPMQAIQAATGNAAEALGWQDRVGTVEAGKFADLIAVGSDPLSEIRVLESVPFVMKGGEVAKNTLR